MTTDVVVISVPCLRCAIPFERKARGPRAKHCADCRRIRKSEADRDRYLIEKADRDLLHAVAENLREYVTPDMWGTIERYIASAGGNIADLPLVDDRMPAGTMTHAGPDEGTSTTLPDLASELEDRRMRAIMHDWFQANPHWLQGVND